MTESYNNNNSNKNRSLQTYVNYNIRGAYVRVIEDGCSPKTMPIDAAVEYAKSKGVDLVLVSYDKANSIAIAKLQEYGKYKYEQQKKEKAAKKAARVAAAVVKEVCFSIRIDKNDKSTKIKHIKEFLSNDKMKVKIIVKLSRREMNLIGMAKDLMREILSNFDSIAEIDCNPSFMGGIMSCTLRAKKKL